MRQEEGEKEEEDRGRIEAWCGKAREGELRQEEARTGEGKKERGQEERGV